ncbi:MAG: MarR family transcriptional regulator [Deltaproteobacteria bacterium]|nr:MarR family transcriptional regulator [Deltaproteobacteria bacterium]
MKTEGIISLISTIRDKANRFIFHELKARGITDIVPAHGGIFVHLFRNRELPMGEIARLIDRDKSTVTTLVEKLVKLGYLKREKDPDDHRVTIVRLTKEGKVLEADFENISKELLKCVYTGFSDQEKEMAIQLLARIKSNF